jgi:hypothetical protein
VHTSAPSRGQDDTRYRALAHAYLAFEPANRTALDELSQSYSQDEQTDSGLREEPESQASYRPDDEPEVVPSSVASYQNGQLSQIPLSQSLDTTDLSFNSVLDNADSPVFRERLVARAHPAPARHAQTETQNSSDSWQQPPSTIADSQPENNLASETRPSPTKVPWASLRQMEGPRDSSSGSRLPALGKIAPSNTEAESQAEMEVTESMDLSPIIIFPTAQRSTRDDRRAHSSHDHGASFPQGSRDTMKRKHSALSSSQPDTSSSVPEGGPSKVQDKSSAKTRKSKQFHKPERSLDTMQPEEKTPTQVATQSSLTSSASRASYASVLEIRGPPPVTSMAKLTLDMLSTPSLDQLAQKMPLDVLFRPQTQTRELHAMERGYWSVNFKAWNEDLRGRAWDCLGNFVGKGQAGWAVWCFREEDFGDARVYCWGAIVGQIYLLLYMASESKIKWSGATWRGGDGQPVITMPSK